MKQFEYQKLIGFTNQQKEAFVILEKYGVNVNQFIRAAISDKFKKDWKGIKEKKLDNICPF